MLFAFIMYLRVYFVMWKDHKDNKPNKRYWYYLEKISWSSPKSREIRAFHGICGMNLPLLKDCCFSAITPGKRHWRGTSVIRKMKTSYSSYKATFLFFSSAVKNRNVAFLCRLWCIRGEKRLDLQGFRSAKKAGHGK